MTTDGFEKTQWELGQEVGSRAGSGVGGEKREALVNRERGFLLFVVPYLPCPNDSNSGLADWRDINSGWKQNDDCDDVGGKTRGEKWKKKGLIAQGLAKDL